MNFSASPDTWLSKETLIWSFLQLTTINRIGAVPRMEYGND